MLKGNSIHGGHAILCLPYFPSYVRHAFATLVIASIAVAYCYWRPSPQAPWFLLSSLLFSQAGLRAEVHWQSAWKVLYYILYGVLAALAMLLLSLSTTWFFTALLLASAVFIAMAVGWQCRQYFFAALTVSLFMIVAAFSPGSFALILSRASFIVLGSGVVFLVRFPLFFYQRARAFTDAQGIFFQKLQQVYRLIFYTAPQRQNRFSLQWEESHFQVAWRDCLSALLRLKEKSSPPYCQSLEQLWDVTLSLGSLRYRLTDYTVFNMAQEEMRALLEAILSIFKAWRRSPAPEALALGFTNLRNAIQNFEALYQTMLQTVAKEPLVLLLFIQDLYALQEELERQSLPGKEPQQQPPRFLAETKRQSSTAFALHRAMRTSSAVFLAMLASHYFSKTQTVWLPVVAVLLTQSEWGFPLQHSLRRFFWIMMAFFIFGRTDLFDVLMGAAIAFGATLFIFPDKPDQAFSERVLPLLQDLSGYLAAVVDLLLGDKHTEQGLSRCRHTLEERWANADQMFPVWVFEAGFNPALRPGQYYFVVHLGQATEILFAMAHYARHPFPGDLLSQFVQPIQESVLHSQELLSHLTALLQGKPPALSQTDFMADLPVLEECFQSKINLSLELLDISRDYVYLAAFIRYLKDLRLQLLQLAATLS